MARPLAGVDAPQQKSAIEAAILAVRMRRLAQETHPGDTPPVVPWEPMPWQRLPPGDAWQNWLLMGGRGSGKTRTGAHAMDSHARGIACLPGPTPHRMAIIQSTADDAIDIDIRGESGLLSIDPDISFSPGARLRASLLWPNGSEAEFYGASKPEDVETLRGPQFCFAWLDELAAWRYLDGVWQMLDFGLRLGPAPKRVITTTPKARKRLTTIKDDPRTVVTITKTSENPFLSEQRRAELYAEYGGTRLGRQELDAEILGDIEGALWKRDEMIEANRRKVRPELIRIIVAIDPSVTGGDTSDEAGIIVAGIDDQVLPHAYVLDDVSLRGSPLVWARRAIGAYADYSADRVIGETNNGGEMIELTLRSVDRNVSYKSVTASRGKAIRAEPVVSLYEQGRVHHVGALPELEDELCTWIPGEGKSPNRLDALVWAISELLVRESSGLLTHYRRANVAEQSPTIAN